MDEADYKTGTPECKLFQTIIGLFLWRWSQYGLERGRELKSGRIIVFIQFAFIVLLVYAHSSEYRSNPYQQTWISENAWPLQYFLNGYLAAGLIGVLIGGAVLLVADYLQDKNRSGGLKTAI